MSRLLHGWLPVLLVLGLLAGLLVLAHRKPARPLELRDLELAPWSPYGSHPVVLPQTFLVTPSVTPSAPPIMPTGQTPVVAA